MRVAIGADHGGFDLKQELAALLKEQNYDVQDYGAAVCIAGDDYPDYAAAVGHAVASGKAERGIIICGSGVGACIVANKVRGVRAAICHDVYTARQGVEHDDMNVLCLGERIIGIELALECSRAFLGARFSGEPRHVRRLNKVLAIEASESGEEA